MAYLIPPSTLENQSSSCLHSPPLKGNITPGDVGILRSTLLPSFALYSSLSLATYIAADATDRVELKDWLWPSAQVLNAWWTAIGQPMTKHGISFGTAYAALPWTKRVLLSCVAIWGTRLFARIAYRSFSRGTDDARYEVATKEPGFWKGAFLRIFLPEAAVLSVISLPFTVPFTMDTGISIGDEVVDVVRALAVGVFSAGFALEAMADTQLALHRQERTDLCRHGVWGLVRHPK
jgi:steroid 5-alpha reductase family enzyme